MLHVFRDSYNLKRHLELKHGEIKYFKCLICSYRSARSNNLLRHCERNHSEKLKSEDLGFLRCSVCRKLFSSLQSLNNHIKIHEAIAVGYECPICNSKMSENHFCYFDCKVCDRTFRSKLDLKGHIKIHVQVVRTSHAVSLLDNHEKLEEQLEDLDFNWFNFSDLKTQNVKFLTVYFLLANEVNIGRNAPVMKFKKFNLFLIFQR